jgi:hypothetical protein
MTVPEPGFDDRGVPRSVEAARAMSPQQVLAAVLSVALDLEDIEEADFLAEITRGDDTTEILSDLGVDIYGELVPHLFPQHRLREIDVDEWSSIEGVARVVFDIFQSEGNHGSTDS